MTFNRSMNRRRRGMSLVELMIVVGVLGVIFAAVFFFFTKGMEQFHFSRRQNELATAGRLALEQITDEIIWAGYLPHGGIDGDLWHPIHETEQNTFTFYADYHEPWGQVDDDEYRRILLAVDNTVLITDKAAMQRRAGYNISSLQFVYMDEDGDELAQPLSLQDRDAVRHIRVTLVLQDTYMGDIYHTTMRTTISPRNLGLNRDIDPMFIPVPPLSGIVVLNVDGDSLAFAPTPHQYRMLHKMAYWGLTVISLTDDMLETYDYVGNEIDIVLLRDIPGMSYHSWMNGPLNALPCAVICMDPQDAAFVYGMALATGSTNLYYDNVKVVPAHHIHDGIPDGSTFDLVFTMYDSTLVPPVTPVMNYIENLTPITETITSINAFGFTPGLVSVRDEAQPTRRVFYGLPAATGYTEDGYKFFRNVLHWTLGGAGGGNPGDPITASEGFEGAGSAVTPVVLWADDLNSPQVVSDSIPLFSDDFSAKGGRALTWITYSLGPDGVVGEVDESLRMQRRVAGAQTRNLAGVVLDLSPYSIFTDNLYLKVSTLRGTNETIDASDGVFFLDFTGVPRTILTQNFNNVGMASGDITFWGSLYGRSRVHAPAGWPGNSGFVTLDSRRDGFDGRVRMMIEVPTTGLASNTQFTVNYRFHDHNDQNHAYNSGDGTGDFLGWNSHGVIEGAVNHVADFVPQSYGNNEWTERTATFTISGAPPDPLFLVFAQYDNGIASGFSANRGISIDDVVVIAGSADTTYTRIGVPSSGADWSTIRLNLNSAAMPPSGPGFVSGFFVLLSQAGTGPWNTHGISWDDFEVGMAVDRLTMPGWTHAPILTGIDDWSVHQSTSDPSDYMWGLHANHPDFYSNYAHCYLETPSFMVPLEAIDPELSFRSDFEFETGYDYGYVQVSVNSGAWVDLGLGSGLLYNAVIGGRNVFTGSRSWSTEVIDLAPYAGSSVRFRFVFYSDLSVIREGWYLDDFYAQCLIEGHEISAIDFQTSVVASMTFDHVDVYLGSTDQATLSGGSWEPSGMFLAYSGPLTFNNTQQWQTISLDNSYFLPVDANLRVKIVSDNQTMGFGTFRHQGIDNVCRAAWGGTPPTFLPVQPTRPTTRVTVGGSPVTVGEGGTQYSSNMPVSFDNRFTDFEAIYTAPELGLFNPVTWTSGGTTQGTAGNEWEIGAPAFWPAPDPALTSENGTSIAGTDLTINGYYEDEAWWWFASSGYQMADAAAYDTVNVRFYRCLKLASNDFAYVQIAFDDDPDRNPDELTWETVRTYNGVYDNIWQYETINLTPAFNAHSTFDYYFVRFVLSSGLWLKQGGWNLDNIQFFGRTEAK